LKLEIELEKFELQKNQFFYLPIINQLQKLIIINWS